MNNEPINKEQNDNQDLEANQNQENEIDELQEAKDKAQEHYDAMLRARAELENSKKRNLEDLEKMRKFCIESFAESLLSVMDSLQAALKDDSSVENIKKGVELTQKQLQSAFDKHKVQAIEPIGEILNPSYHQAISMQPSDKPVNTIIEVVQKGYTLSERLMRPALVVVSSGSN